MALACPPTAPPAKVPGDPFIESLFNDLDYAMLNFLCGNDAIATYAQIMWRAAAIIGIAVIGFNLIFGGQMTLRNLMLQLVKIVVVAGIIASATTFNSIFYTVSNVWPNYAASQFFVNGSGVGTNAASVNGVLNQFMDDGFQLSRQVLDDAGWWKGFMDRVFSALVAVVVILFTFAAMLLVTLSKLAVGIILAVGPIFVIGLMFPPTRGYFESWLKALLTFALIPLMLYALMAMILSIGGEYITLARAEDLGGRGAFVQYVAPVVVVTLIGIALMTQIQGIAAQLAGGISMTTQAGLSWAGQAAQGKARSMAGSGLSKAGAMAGGAAGAAARAPINFGRGMASAGSKAPRLTGPGYKPSPMTNFRLGAQRAARNLRGKANAARSKGSEIRSAGIAYSAGAGTRRSAATVRAATKRVISSR